MIQLYFLAILCCGFAGYVLFAGGNNSDQKALFSISFDNQTFNLILGIICAVTGVLKLLAPLPSGEQLKRILIFGDIFPAAAGIIAGLIFIFGIYRQDKHSGSGKLDHAGAALLTFRKPIGFALMLIAVVHFLFGELLFL